MAPNVKKKIKKKMMHGWGTFGIGNTKELTTTSVNPMHNALATIYILHFPKHMITPSHLATLNNLDSLEHPFIA
jgi:hypothetical protein